jgi:hypothetical protein
MESVECTYFEYDMSAHILNMTLQFTLTDLH